jgi:acetyl esterase/lipase
LAVISALAGLLGIWLRAPFTAIAGLASAVFSTRYVWGVITSSVDWERAFGASWQQILTERQNPAMLKGRWTWLMTSSGEPRLQQDVVFCVLPETERKLLCDLWLPPAGVAPSGVAVIYFHGSGWYLGDKDLGTRSFFRQLAVQGHVVMDVAYRMCPETDLRGMVGDVKRAIAWMKSQGPQYGVDPGRVVLIGGSAGGHLALLGAYTADHPELTPAELGGTDLSVRAVIAYYAPSDMRAVADYNRAIGYDAYRPTLADGLLSPPPRHSPEWRDYQRIQWARIGNLAWDMLGGKSEEAPTMYDLASPIGHIHAGCPLTMLIHGNQDLLVPIEGSRAVYAKLVAANVPVVCLELPNTDHAFDLVLPRLSLPAQVALYEIERFLLLAAGGS